VPVLFDYNLLNLYYELGKVIYGNPSNSSSAAV